MTGTDDNTDDLDVLAGEYVLGVMSEQEQRAFEARLAAEPTARVALAAARERLLELDLTAPRVAPRDGLWQRIEAGIGDASVIDIATRRTPPRAANENRPSRQASRFAGGFWQGFVAASVVAAIAAGVAWSTLWPDHPKLVVVLLDAQAQPVSIVEAYGDQRIRVVPLGRIAVPAGKTLQVWTLPDPATGPVSMGLLSTQTATTLDGPPLPQPRLEQLYEITLEPAGGSPTGKPTGPIIGKGFAKAPQI